MTPIESVALMRQVAEGTLDPIAAADLLRGNRESMIGLVGFDLGFTGPEDSVRCQAMMGRLLWLTLRDSAATPLSEPTGLVGYQDFLLTALAEGDDDGVPEPGTGS